MPWVHASEPLRVGLVRFRGGGEAGGLACAIAERDDVDEEVPGSGGLACKAGVGCVGSWRACGRFGGEAGGSFVWWAWVEGRAPGSCARFRGGVSGGVVHEAGIVVAGGGGERDTRSGGERGGGMWGAWGVVGDVMGGGSRVVGWGSPVVWTCSWARAVRYACWREIQVSREMCMGGRGGESDMRRVSLSWEIWSISSSVIRNRASGAESNEAIYVEPVGV